MLAIFIPPFETQAPRCLALQCHSRFVLICISLRILGFKMRIFRSCIYYFFLLSILNFGSWYYVLKRTTYKRLQKCEVKSNRIDQVYLEVPSIPIKASH